MSMAAQVQSKPAPPFSFTPVRANLLQRKCACGGTPGPDGECAECRRKRLSLQRRVTDQATPATVPTVVHEVLGSPGQPLDPGTRTFMESRFGHDFSRVRVHTDVKARGSAQQINALAYTVGRDIVFASGQYAPETTVGRRVLAHELMHVIQQGAETVDPEAEIGFAESHVWEQEADATALAVEHDPPLAPTRVRVGRAAPTAMLLTPADFRAKLGSTPEQKSAIDTLFANKTFLDLWKYLESCGATPAQDLGPLALKVTPGLKIGGVERFGGYSPLTRTLEINPTKPEHVSNPTELVDTIVHELIHAVDDLQADCVAAGSSAAPLAGAATVLAPSRTAAAAAGTEAKFMTELGPGASNPCGEFIDINAAAQQMIIQILTEDITVARIGHPTVTFVNEILRRDPAAMTEYEACRSTACKKPTAAEQRKAVARCSAEIIGKFMPADLVPALLPTRVYFDFDSSTLQPGSLETLNLVALFLKAHPTTTIKLVGHADPVGAATYNLDLGDRRAKAVEKELLDKGVDPKQIASVTSRGEKDLVSTSSTDRWKDRRVEISIVTGAPGP